METTMIYWGYIGIRVLELRCSSAGGGCLPKECSVWVAVSQQPLTENIVSKQGASHPDDLCGGTRLDIQRPKPSLESLHLNPISGTANYLFIYIYICIYMYTYITPNLVRI